MQKDQVVILRKTGMSWPKIAKQLGISRSSCQRIFSQESDGVAELPPPEDEVIRARVLKLVPNPRLMLIYFDDREGIARCVKRTEDNRPPKSEVYVKKIEGEDDLYRVA